MKKYIAIFMGLFLSFGLFSCNKKIDADEFYEEFEEKYNKIDKYSVDFELKIEGDEEIKFSGNTCYLKDDFYKVSLTNTQNNNKQVIIKNKSGVFVLTPALNKCFKFPSSWPDNSSHAYLLSSIKNDIMNDDKREIKEEDDYFVVSTKIDSKTNASLSNQRIMFNKETLMPAKVYIYDSNMNLKMSVSFSNYDFNASLDESNFNEEANLTGLLLEYGEGSVSYENMEFSAPTSINYDVDIYKYPDDNMCMWHYKGEVNFTLVEERIDSEISYNPYTSFNEPVLLNVGIAALGNNKLIWHDNGIEYKIYSDSLTVSQMVEIANMI